MSSSDNPPQDTSRRDERRDNNGGRPSNIIEFVDTQDPNARSAIQRHTAYHAAAQRREARSRLLRRSSQTRYLEWARRPRSDTEIVTSSTSSASSVSISPAPSLPERLEQPTRTSSNEQEAELTTAAEPASGTISPTSQAGISADDTVLDFIVSTFCDHYNSREIFESSITLMLENDASRHLLLAYAYAMRRSQPASHNNPQDQVDAQTNLGLGTNILWNRLQMPGHASSDANIQAVLLLLAYTADFGQASEVRIHADALRTMLDQRGGIDAFTDNPALQHQITAIERSRRFHLTLDCDPSCPDPIRFPDGLRLRQGNEV